MSPLAQNVWESYISSNEMLNHYKASLGILILIDPAKLICPHGTSHIFKLKLIPPV